MPKSLTHAWYLAGDCLLIALCYPIYLAYKGLNHLLRRTADATDLVDDEGSGDSHW